MFHFGGVHVSKNRNHAVLRDQVFVSERDQIFLVQVLHRFRRTVRAQGVRVIGEQRLPQNIARDRGQLFFFLFNSRHLNLFFARDRLLRERRVQQNIAEQFDTGFQVRLHHVNADAHAVVARVARDRSADGFDLIRNLFRGARFCSLEQCARSQTGDSICFNSLRQQPAPKNCAHRNQRQARIFAHEQTQTVRELEFLNRRRRRRFRDFLFRAERTLRIQRRDREILIDKIFDRDAANIIERHFLDGVEIIAAEIQISR